VKVHIEHDGTAPDPRHSERSLHTFGRAVDVMVVTTTDAKGVRRQFDFQKTNPDRVVSPSCSPARSAECRFFEGFRACWHELHVARRCPARQDGPLGTLGWEDKAHIAHHLHTSLPFCPDNKGNAITLYQY
jgi:hypothetical protein